MTLSLQFNPSKKNTLTIKIAATGRQFCEYRTKVMYWLKQKCEQQNLKNGFDYIFLQTNIDYCVEISFAEEEYASFFTVLWLAENKDVFL